MTDLFRKNAGIVVFNADKKVLLCQRNDMEDSWQFPQGGIDEGETVIAAAKRELFEETSLKNVVWVKSLDYASRYHFPPEILQKMKQHGYKNLGQDMYWSLFYFGGQNDEINLNTAIPEFKNFRWGTMNEAIELIVDFKKSAYEVARGEFTPLIENYPV